ncbi:hypothetical protein ABZX98_12060 [Streptomyces sp. NPDC002992]|uniref:hypothetical protein n=1 Tax=Streptomyces sp. NPDC002992 TaxID=3154273 RepID=UPI0033B46B7F
MASKPLFRFGTYNLLDLEIPKTAEHKQRYDRLVAGISAAYRGRTGVLGVQELLGDTKQDARRLLRMLAEDAGMRCEATPARREKPVPALASQTLGASVHRYHVGLLWTEDVEPIVGTMRAYEGGTDFWHAMVSVDVRTDGVDRSRWCSYHGNPFSPDRRLHEAYRILGVFQDPKVPGGVAADWNSLSAARRPDGSYYDAEPYLDQCHRKVRYQAVFDPDHSEAPQLADRRSSEILQRGPGGLMDPIAALDAPWEASCGYWLDGHGRSDDFGLRRIDVPRVTEDLVRTLRTCTTHSGSEADLASDHRMVTCDMALKEWGPTS